MLTQFRGFAKSPFAALLLGVLIVSFAVWGVRDAFKVSISNAVVKAGSHEVSKAEFKTIFDRVVRQQEQQQGRGIPREEALAAGLDRRILADMADTNALAELIKRVGIKPDDKLVAAEIAKNPAFTDPLTGRFSDSNYRRVLSQNEMTPAIFEASLKDEIASRHFLSGLGAGTHAPRIYAAMMAAYLMENRSADYMVLGEHSVPAPKPPTDADLKKFMQENAAQLKQPEFRVLSMVRFSAQAVAQTAKADPAEVQKQFDLEKDRLSTPERRAFTQVLVKDAAAAASAAQRLGKGESPAAVAKALGGTSTPYPATSQRAIPDAHISAAVFALQPGQVSAPVKSEFGFAVVKLTSIAPAKPATLEEARPRIESELNAKAAQNTANEQADKYQTAHDAGQPLAKAAEAAGVKVYNIGAVTAEGVNYVTRKKDPSLNQKMLTDAFALPEGGETDVQDLGRGEYYAIRVDKIIPSALPELDKIRAPLAQRYMMVDLVKRLQARAKELQGRLDKGEPIDKVAASAGLKVQHVQNISRATARAHADLGEEFLGSLLQGKPGSVFVARSGAGIAVGKVGPATPGPLAEVARAAEQGRAQVDSMVVNDFGDALREAARQKIKPRISEANARQALGVSPEEAAAQPKPAKAK
jgi:peptidyl-prolyl cis-trans isomerase D